ncbi:MAG: DUF190 domain-containing protein [Bacillota bacterium]|nr:DUF190 domain-containing protein [Bacillota bacterium]
MKISSNGKLLKIFLNESDKFHNKPLHYVILKKIKESNLAAAVVIKGIEGYELNSDIHSARILRMSNDLPVIIEVIGSEERINSVIIMIEEFITTDLMMVLQDVNIIKYRKDNKN